MKIWNYDCYCDQSWLSLNSYNWYKYDLKLVSTMYTLRGIFPEPHKAPKINFIKENVRQLNSMQRKTAQELNRKTEKISQVRSNTMDGQALAGSKSLSSAKPTKQPLYNVSKSSPRPVRTKNNIYEEKIKIKKGDMAEFLRRKELRQSKPSVNSLENNVKPSLTVDIPGNVRDVACQTVESSLSQQVHDGAILTVLYPKSSQGNNDECDENTKMKASGDSKHYPVSPKLVSSQYKPGEASTIANEQLNKSQNNLPQMFKNDNDNRDDKDPYLPSTYQKGMVPKYLRERKEKQKEAENKDEVDLACCPPGHITLPDNERKETLKMLRNSFAELVSELNKMPIRTDTLRMRNRKVELEKQLAKLEEGIKVFSRPKVFVKIGE